MTDSSDYSGPDRRGAPRDSSAEIAAKPVFGVLRWIRAHVSGFHAAVGVFLLIGLGVALSAVLLFAGVAALMTAGTVQRFDDAVLLWINNHTSDTLDILALEITALGSGAAVWMLVMVGSVFLWTTTHRYSAALLWIAALGAPVVNSALKMLFDRPRPQLFDWRTEYAGLSSFPSGHSATAMVVYATLAYLVVRLEPSRRLRRITIGIAAVVILLIGITRLYLGVHYPSDVIAGYLVGLIWATVCALGIEAVKYFRYRKPEVAEDEVDLDKGVAPIREATGG